MKDKIEKLMNSTNKEDILLAFSLVKHLTKIQTPIVLYWWIERNCGKIEWNVRSYQDMLELWRYTDLIPEYKQILIDHSEIL